MSLFSPEHREQTGKADQSEGIHHPHRNLAKVVHGFVESVEKLCGIDEETQQEIFLLELSNTVMSDGTNLDKLKKVCNGSKLPHLDKNEIKDHIRKALFVYFLNKHNRVIDLEESEAIAQKIVDGLGIEK